jgi:Mrp family chromosome partitioning ATPase
MECPGLLDKRLLIVSGKGGVGKSVVASTLGWIAARQGKRTLLVELDTVASIARMFGRVQEPGYRETTLAENLSCFYVEGKSGLEEYLHLVLKSGAFVRRIVRTPIYQYFVNVAPGLKELMAVGKLWDLEQKRVSGTDRPYYDLIVVDTPATGHVVSYLQMPMTAARTAKGFVRREAQKVADLLQDPARTAFHIVTTPAEMPVNEAMGLLETARSGLGLPVGRLFVNQVVPPFFEGSERETYHRWKHDVNAGGETGSPPQARWAEKERTILACAESWKRSTEIQGVYLQKLLTVPEIETTPLPFLAAPQASVEMLQTLARSIEDPGDTTNGRDRAEPGS